LRSDLEHKWTAGGARLSGRGASLLMRRKIR
jgi:hypothetical protein